MRVDAYSQISQVYGVSGKIKTTSAAKSSGTDKVEISGFGREMQIAKKALGETPDVREDKVADLKERINNGTYEVSGDSFAEKLLAKYDELRG